MGVIYRHAGLESGSRRHLERAASAGGRPFHYDGRLELGKPPCASCQSDRRRERTHGPRCDDRAPSAGSGLSDAASVRGREIFVDRACIACHSIGGLGATVGPDLSKVGSWAANLTEDEWRAFLEAWISDPTQVENRLPGYWSNYGGPILDVSDLPQPSEPPPTQMPPSWPFRGRDTRFGDVPALFEVGGVRCRCDGTTRGDVPWVVTSCGSPSGSWLLP